MQPNKFGVAEGVGFEPTEGTRPSTAFKAAAFVHSATPPSPSYLGWPPFLILGATDNTTLAGGPGTWRRLCESCMLLPATFN